MEQLFQLAADRVVQVLDIGNVGAGRTLVATGWLRGRFPVRLVTPILMRAANIILVNTIVVAYVPFLPPPRPTHPGTGSLAQSLMFAGRVLAVPTIVEELARSPLPLFLPFF